MRTTLLITVILGSILVLGNAVGNAASIGDPGTTVYGSAPIGHLQPRAEQFPPHSPAEQVEQQNMSMFDAQQRKLDEELDKKLNICRGC
jgi:hypothetical protein